MAPPAELKPGEVVDRRTASSRTTYHGDGTFTTSLFTAPVHFRDADGAWQPISSQLVDADRPGYAWKNKANSFGVLFRPHADADFLRFERDGAAFSLSLEGAGRRPARASGPRLSYESVLPGVDLEYEILPEGVKETLVLASVNVPTRYRFHLSTSAEDPVEALEQPDGSWAFFMAPHADPIFVLAAPVATEAPNDGAMAADPERHASMAVTKVGTGFDIALTIDRTWLRDPDRQFPVHLDPTITIQPSVEDAYYAATCTGCRMNTGTRMYIGTDNSNAWRGVLQFDLGDIPPGTTLSSATLGLYHDGTYIANSTSKQSTHTLDVHRMTAAWSTTTLVSDIRFDAAALRSYALDLNVWPRWMSWDITSTVQGWMAGTQPNFGLLVKRNTEPLGVSGAVPPGRRYTTDLAVRPKLDVTYTSDAVDLLEPATLHSNGADLAWTRFSPPSGAAFQRYEVHRSLQATYQPSDATRLTTITDINVTKYRDTTAAPNGTFTYKIVANSSPSAGRTVTLPADGLASKVLQPTPTVGKATYMYYSSTMTNCANYGRDASMYVGTSASNKYRPIIAFDLRDIPSGATINSATMSLWQRWSSGTAATVNVHRVTRGWQEGTGLTQCTGDGATWYETQSGVPWTTQGGDYATTASASLASPTGESASWDNFAITSLVQQWVSGQVPNHGVVLKYSSETLLDGNNFAYYSDDYTVAPTQRPKLAITYKDGSHAQGPTVSVAAPGAEAQLSGTAVRISAAATDDRRVDKVEFLVDGVVVASDTAAPFETSWNSTSVANGARSLSARAQDDAGNVTTSAAVPVTVENSDPPTTNVTSPSGGATVSGDVTVSADAADDFGVTKVEFLVDGLRVAEDDAAPYSVTWNTLDESQPAYDGVHSVTARAYDAQGQSTASAPVSVTVANTTGTPYRAGFQGTAVPEVISYDPAATTQEIQPIELTITNTSASTWQRDAVSLRYRWVSADAPPVVTEGATVPLPADVRKDRSVSLRLDVVPPSLPAGVERAQYRLVVDMFDSAAGVWFSARGNAPLENSVIVNKVLRTGLGLERYYHYQGEELGAGMQHLVNVANGNSLLRWTPFSSPGRALSTVLDLTYNSLEQRSESPVGNNFSLSISSLTRFGLPLDIHPNHADSIAGRANRWIAFTDGDGTTHRFEGRIASNGAVVWDEPPGVHLYLRAVTDGWALTRPDRVTFFYDTAGYPTRVQDANGNTLTFTLEDVPPGEDPGGPKRRIIAVTDAAGDPAVASDKRTFRIDYYTKDEAQKPQIRGQIERITDHSGSELYFDYYEDGNLLRITQRGGAHADGSFLADRTFVFTYTNSAGDGPAISDPAARVKPDARTRNQSSRLFSVRDPRGKETTFTYYGPTSGQLRWKLSGRTDRAGATTAFSYDIETRVTTVTAPLSRVTKYGYDTSGQVTSITNPLNQVTTVAWGEDRHVEKVTEPTGASVEFRYNANGYLTDRWDQLRNHTLLEYEDLPVDANDAAKHISQLVSKTEPLGTASTTVADDFRWTFTYDARGNLLTVSDPLGFATTYTYNPDGTQASMTDANLRKTSFEYDANGLVSRVVDAKSQTTSFGYDDDGLLLWVQDPLHASYSGGDPRQYRSYFDYDSFGRLGRQSAPKQSKPGSTEPLIWTAASYDANDNLVRQVGAHYGVQFTPSLGAVTTAAFDAMDRVTLVTAPDRSADPLGERTAYAYDAAGRTTQVTSPRGEQTTHSSQDFATHSTYDALDRVIRQQQFAVDAAGVVTQTLTSHLCYDTAGDLRSVTSPNANLTSVNCSAPPTVYTTRFEYDAAHRQLATIDPLSRRSSTAYDANGRVASTTNANNVTTTRKYDQRGLLTHLVQPFNGSRTITTHIQYDKVGNQLRVISPRAWDASADKVNFAQFVTSYTYDAVNQLIRVDLPTSTLYPQQLYVHTDYDANGRPNWNSIPVVTADPEQVKDTERTRLTYFDPGWIATSDEPDANPRVHFNYTAQGWQTTRTPENPTGGGLNTGQQVVSSYFVDGMPSERKDRAGHSTTYTYDANNNLLTAVDSSGMTNGRAATEVQATYDAFDRVARVGQRDKGATAYRYTGLTYDLNGNVKVRTDDATLQADGSLLGRAHEYTYNGADWLTQHIDRGATSLKTDDQRITTAYTPIGLEQSRVVYRYDSASVEFTQQTTNWTWFDNAKLKTLTTKNRAGTVVESHTVSYTEAANGVADAIYVNGHRTRDAFTVASAADTANPAPCRTLCTASYTYDPRDRLVTENNGHGSTTTYKLDPAGNVIQEAIAGEGARTTDYTFIGNQMQTAGTGGVITNRYHYDPDGNLDCVTLATGTVADCNTPTGGTTSLKLRADYSYDLDRLVSYNSFTTNGTTSTKDDSATYIYDALDRVVSQTETHGTSAARTTRLSYLGLTNQASKEEHFTGSAAVASQLLTTKSYTYDARGNRIGMTDDVTDLGDPTTTGVDPAPERFSYGYDVHGSVSLLLSETGASTASYGYRPYGGADDELTYGDFDPADAAETTKRKDNPLNAYRYTAKRFDSGSGSLDMGARRFGPDTGRFLQRDHYNGALADLRLSVDPLTQNRYSLAGGNPVSFVEVDGHRVMADGGGGSSSVSTATPEYYRDAYMSSSTSTSSGSTGFRGAGGSWDDSGSEGEEDEGFLGAVHTVLDFGGLIPGLGEPLDLINAGIYALEGDWANAGLSAGSAIPVFGYGATAAKFTARYGDDVAGLVTSAFRGSDEATAAGRETAEEAAQGGTTVYRVWGDGSGPWGQSWTTVDPSTVPNFRSAAGLPDVNAGRFVSQGTLESWEGVQRRASSSINPGQTGGLPELVIPDPFNQVRLTGVYGVNPPY